MAEKTKLLIEFIRHGQTLANDEKRYIGRTDEPLSDAGIAQLQKIIKRRNKNDIIQSRQMPDMIFSSPMKRCIQTAEIFGAWWKERLSDREIIIIDKFREIDFGDFEMKNYAELKDNPDYQRWIDSGGKIPFPEGESRDEFIRRCVVGYNNMLKKIEQLYIDKTAFTEQNGPEGKSNCEGIIRVLAVVHGGTIMAVLSSLTGGDYYDYQCGNGEGYILEVEPDSGEIIKCYKWPG